MSPSALNQWWTLRYSGDELMPTKCPHSSHPSNLQDRTSARLLTSPFHGGAESRVQIPELRVPMSPQMLHGPLSKHAAPPPQSGILPCTKHSHLAPHSFTRYQPLISGCRVWKTLLSYSHDTSPPTAVCRV